MSYYYNKNTEQYINVEFDESGVLNPREDFNPLSEFYTWEKDYSSPDKNFYENPTDFLKAHNFEVGEKSFLEIIKEMGKEYKDGYYIYPVERYEHGHRTYSLLGTGTQCKHDTCFVGFISIKEDHFKEVTCKDFASVGVEYLKELLNDELDLYNKYVNDESYYMVIYDKDGYIDDCLHGYFLGSEEEVLKEEFANVAENIVKLGEFTSIEQAIFRAERRDLIEKLVEKEV